MGRRTVGRTEETVESGYVKRLQKKALCALTFTFTVCEYAVDDGRCSGAETGFCEERRDGAAIRPPACQRGNHQRSI